MERKTAGWTARPKPSRLCTGACWCGALAVCAWLWGAHWLVGLLLAGVGCLLQYLAYRLRTCYALSIARQRQAEAAQAVGSIPAGDGEREKILSGHENARLSDKSSPELLHSMGKGL